MVEVLDKALTTVIAALRADPKAPIQNTLMKAITTPLPDEYSTFLIMWSEEKAHGISKILFVSLFIPALLLSSSFSY